MSIKNIFSSTVIALILLLSSCKGNKPEEKQEEGFTISDTMMKRIKVETVRSSIVIDELRLSGKVVADEEKVFKIVPLAGGTVMQVNVELGDYVEKGTVLAIIKSSEAADFERQRIDAESNLKIAQKNADAAEDMFKSKLISEKEYITAQNELQKAKSEVNKVSEIYGIYNIGGNSQYIIKSPIAGFVIEKKLNNGMQIRSDMSETIFTISQLSDVWVLANVYESDIAKVKVGYHTEITTLSYPDMIFTGQIDKLFNVLDPLSKVMKVRIKLENKDNLLKPEMFANVSVSYLEEGKKLPQILSKAIIFDKNKNFVMVYKDRSHVETREIEIYRSTGIYSYIKHGLSDGEKIISVGHMLIYDQLND
ncbi:MAG: efflux RND transporter periplasmic adaptor subunit [Bacteroidia bacterium]